MPYGVVCRTFLPIRFLPLNPRFRQTSLLPAPTQYFERTASACKTQLDRGSLLHHEIPTDFGDRFYFVSLPAQDWRQQWRLGVCFERDRPKFVCCWGAFLRAFFLNSLGTPTHFSLQGTISFSSPLWRKINKRFLKGVWGELFSKRVLPNNPQIYIYLCLQISASGHSLHRSPLALQYSLPKSTMR